MSRWLIVSTFVLFAGCSLTEVDTVPPTNVASTNAVRKAIGIRQIQKNWKFYIREFDCEKWQAGNSLVKIVQLSGTEEEHAPVLWEQDYYYGTGWLRDPDGDKMKEQVVVSHDYTQSRFFVAYVGENANAKAIISSIIVYEPKPGIAISELGHAGANDAETLKVADKLLKLIGKNRLTAG